MTSQEKPIDHEFGGDWTEVKLRVVANYLEGYTTALKNQTFEKIYIDAFAGTGYRATPQKNGGPDTDALLLPDLAEEEPQGLLDGSVRRALNANPPFDRYVFIERNSTRCAQLQSLKQEFPHLAQNIEICQGDANSEIQLRCSKSWASKRGVLFLDPYGMQVEWATIQAIANTRAIDLWILFPLGIGVNRLLLKSGKIPPGWRKRLDLLLGTQSWYDEFYKVEVTHTLFGDDQERVIKATLETIGRYFIRRLETIFAGVAPKPAVLSNSKGCPLYLLCFAVGNERGRNVALRIANHLLKRVN